MADYFTSQQMQQPVLAHNNPHPSQNSMGQQPSRMDPPKRSPVPERMMGPGGQPVYVLPSRQEIPYRQSSSPSMHSQHPQQRQGVIQRANPGSKCFVYDFRYTSCLLSSVCLRKLLLIKTGGGTVKIEPGRIQEDALATLPVPKEEPRNRVSLPRGEQNLLVRRT
jgi:hypothetical protein